ncbi:hypothetical protein BB558_007356 [Smittium angustum]|uniref:Uncharacterized protein n=1 Tax=Smittium angustum TaxID=133377 RepID=A0A2U1IV91_SMIAN|nr:hypothetical protein BB558_007356 [Smittium angustum]
MINTTINNNNTSFGNLSPSSKSKKAKMLYDYVVEISGNAPEELLNYFFHSNKYGKHLKENSNQKLNILALHSSAKTKARYNNFLLSKRQKRSHIQTIEADTISVVEEYLKKNSRCSSNTCRVRQSDGSYLDKPVYYLETTKVNVYTSIINENPNTRLGLKASTKKLKRMGPSHDTKAIIKLQLNVEQYNKHLLIKKHQSDAYKEYLDSLNGDTLPYSWTSRRISELVVVRLRLDQPFILKVRYLIVILGVNNNTRSPGISALGAGTFIHVVFFEKGGKWLRRKLRGEGGGEN